MTKRRLILLAALALCCASLFCDADDCLAAVGQRGDSTAPQDGGGLSSVAILPGGAGATAAAGKAERLLAGVLAALPTRLVRGLSPTAATTASCLELAVRAPLYLSHCAFLC